MSRSDHGRKGSNRGDQRREYWASRLHRGGEAPGRFTKTLTHRKERRIGKQQICVENGRNG